MINWPDLKFPPINLYSYPNTNLTAYTDKRYNMQYELRHRLHGHKKICPSEASKDHVLANSKKLTDRKPIWEVVKEIPDIEATEKVPSVVLDHDGNDGLESSEFVAPKKKASPKKKTAKKKAE